MAKNLIEFQKGLRLPDCLAQYGTEAQCAVALFGWRWPAGFVCPECGHDEDFTALRTREPMQCRHCRHRTSLSAGTLFAHTKLPLTLWFLAMSLLTQRKNAICALELKRHLGVSCPTAWKVKHTFLQVMLERDADRQPGGVSEIDDVSRGGEVHGETPGRGSPDKTPFAAVVAKTDKGHPIALCRSVVAGFRKTEPAHGAAKFIHPDSIVFSGGLACCRGLVDAGIEPRAMVTGRGADGVELPERKWINTILGNVKTRRGEPIIRPASEICRATSRSFATGSIAASTWRPCCRASALRPRGPRPCPTACSSWLRLIGNQLAS